MKDVPNGQAKFTLPNEGYARVSCYESLLPTRWVAALYVCPGRRPEWLLTALSDVLRRTSWHLGPTQVVLLRTVD